MGINVLQMAGPGHSSAPQDIAREDAATFDVYRRLRHDIVTCTLQPDEKLRFEGLRRKYDAGVGTLREALSHLVSDGLVRIDAGRGFRVAPVSIEDLEDITQWRVFFETRAIVESIRAGGDDWEAEVVTSYHLLSKMSLPKPEDSPQLWFDYAEKHNRFHDSLVSGCGSPWLLFFRSALQSQAQRYQALAMSQREHFAYRAPDEHKGIMEAVIGRDEKGASKLIANHIEHTADVVKKQLLSSVPLISPDDTAPPEKKTTRKRGRPAKSA